MNIMVFIVGIVITCIILVIFLALQDNKIQKLKEDKALLNSALEDIKKKHQQERNNVILLIDEINKLKKEHNIR